MKILTILFILFISSAAFSQTAAVRGTVTGQVNAAPLANVSVQITELRRSVETNEQGGYVFIGIPPGRYTIVTHLDGFSDQAKNIEVRGGADANLDFTLSLTALREEVTVTASGTEESVFESFQSVNSIGSVRIKEQASTAIGEVLERESGVGKRSFGPGTSRPVIRGFDGDRVLVLQDGVRNGSLGSQSGDHGEPVDTLNLERLEVIKGPATLLYGSNAIGGVVNAVTSDENDPHEGLRGSFTGLGATNNRQGGASGGIEYGFKKFVFNINSNFVREGDYRTPLGQIPNSGARAYGGNGSMGYYGEKAFLNGYFGIDRRRYGVPYAPLFEEGALLTNNAGEPCETKKEERGGGDCEYDIFGIRDRFSNSLPEIPDEAIDIRMRRNNYRLRGGFRNLKSPIPQANFSIDFTDYRHEEIETADGIDEVATNFFNDVFSFRSVFQQAEYRKLSGRFGFEGYRRSYLTEGAEQLIDGRVRQNNFAVFALEELSFDRVAFQFGGRIESNRYRPTNTTLYQERNFTGFSGGTGLRFGLYDGGALLFNYTHSSRSPALEELYNFGPHIGTLTFEVGNPNLRRERSDGIDFSFRHLTRRVRVDANVFNYQIKDFVFLAPVDEDGDGAVDVEDGLPVAEYLQGDSRFVGADVAVNFDVNDYFSVNLGMDMVDAHLKDNDTPLPRIPPLRGRIGLEARYKGFSFRPEAILAKDQDEVFPVETRTAGYAVFNALGSYTVARPRYAHVFSVNAFNLGDRLYRNHLSFIKELAPEIGRGVRVSYTVRFF